MSFWKEFKEFAMKGNVMDLAIGVIIGGAFGKIVTSLVNDIIMPVISVITGGFDKFENLSVQLNPGILVEKDQIFLKYGSFITNIVDFVIIALSIFIVIKQLNRFKPKPVPTPVTTRECPYCRTNIHLEATRCPNCTSELKQK